MMLRIEKYDNPLLRRVTSILLLFILSAQTFAQNLNPEVVWAMPTSARIKCVTTTPGKMTVEYGTTSALGMSSLPEWRDWPNDDVTRHYVNLLNLQPNTTYHYRVRITPQGGGNNLVSEIRTFKTFRAFPKVLPTVRMCSYLIGGHWTPGDTQAPYHIWNAGRYDKNFGYYELGFDALKAANSNAVATYYGNITNSYATMEYEGNWARWAEERQLSQEEIALHHVVDTTVKLPYPVNDREFDQAIVHDFRDGRWVRYILRHNNFRVPNIVDGQLFIGNSQRWDIMYFTFEQTAAGGYNGVWEYCTAVDSQGKPTQWSPLTVLEDTTIANGTKFGQNGYVRFVPPKARTEWRLCYIPDVYKLPLQWGYYIRFRVTQVGTVQPIIASQNYRPLIYNEDFVPGGNKDSQTIPGWDTSWETNPNNNGDPEYNPNPPTQGGVGVAKSARFKWWSRAWYYRPDLKRFMTNLTSQHYVQFRIEEILGLINSNPNIDGWYCDNYVVDVTPGTAVSPSTLQFIELGTFNAFEYGKLMAEAVERIGIELTKINRILAANAYLFLASPGDWTYAPVLTNRDLMWIYFAMGIKNQEDRIFAAMYYHGVRQSTLNSLFAETAYAVLRRGQYWGPLYVYKQATKPDQNNEAFWNWEKMNALVLHLLIRDPEGERLFMATWNGSYYYGEYLTDPNNSLHRYYIAGIPKHKAYYVDAAMEDLGQPVTIVEPPYTQWVAYPNSWMPGTIPGLFVIHHTASAPQGSTWYFARRFTKCLVVYRTGHGPSDETSMNPNTEFDLGGTYYRLHVNGRIDPTPITRLNLPNHYGVVLIPATQPSVPNVQVIVSTDKHNPKPMDEVTVTIKARNTGNEDARDVNIRTPLPSDVTFISGSLKLNDNLLPDPPLFTWVEVTIPVLRPGQEAVAQFRFVVRPRN